MDKDTSKDKAAPAVPKVKVVDLETSAASDTARPANENGDETDVDILSDEEEAKRKYIRFTRDTYTRQCKEEIERKREEEERANKLNEGYLVDGELRFGNEGEEEEDVLEFDPFLQEGSNLPEDYPEFPTNLYGVPIEEIDKHIKEQVSSKNAMVSLSRL